MEKMSSSIGVRQLTVLGEFKPFGLIAEALDGKVADDAVTDKYEYFLFDPEITRDTDVEDSCDEVSSALTSCGDNELFIRGNRIIWSTGARVFKRFTLRSPVVKVCWCRMGHTAEALLCILQIDCLTIYNNSGEVVSPPLPRAVSSIWPLPFGLLLQQEVEGNIPSRAPFSSTSPLIGARDMFTAPNHMQKGEGNAVCSHLILMDPLDEQEPIFIEDRGKSNVMKEYDEKTIWTSDRVPLMASYNKGKMQHSLWVAEIINSNFDEATACSSNVNPMGVLPKHVSFRRIWHGKGAQMAACKVFMATNDDATPLVCFFHQEQRKLLSVGLQSVEINNEIVFDVKPDMSWIIDAVAASPVTVTRPRVKVGLLPYSDIIVLAPDNVLLLYSGRQCLCRYVLPSCLNKGQHLYDLKFPETSFPNDLKISGLADAVEGRVNVIVNNRQMFRCALRQSPSSLLANDCITALAEGLSSSFYRHFLGVFWRDGDPAHLLEAESSVDSEWDSFCHVIMQLCRKSNDTSQKCSGSVAHSAWDFLLNSQFHNNFCKLNSMFGTSGAASLYQKTSNFSKSLVDGRESSEKPFYSDLLVESLDSLHALYENLKFDNLRKRDLELLAILLCNIAEFLGEDNYLDHYIRDFPGLCKKFMLSRPTSSHKICPSLFRWLENCLQHGCNYTNICDLPPLVRRDASSVVSLARQIVSFYSILSGAELQGKNLSSGVHCNISMGSHGSKEELTVLAMVGERFGLQQLDSLPSGISLPLRHALDKCRDSPPNDWPAAAYVLLGRQDLAMSTLSRECKYREIETPTNVNVISMSTPYMLNLHPVTISSTISDAIGLEGTKFEDTDSVDGSMTDGMEHIFNSSTQLRYGRDLRLNEVRRLLCSSRPVAIQTSVSHSASDQDLQQAQLWHLAQRTTSLPLGRGAFTLATIYTLLTEAFTVPKLVLAGRLPAQQNATVNLDPNIRNIQELKSWPEFHNAVAAGLRLAPLQGRMSRTWIIYNKPEEPNSVHAGLLLALGLHGHLRVLSITDIYQYFNQEHESTTVGLMLGLAASYRGTMQPAISKSLYIHIPGRHPSSYPELELPTLLQSAALMSLGILYEGSAHPQTMQALLGEIGRRSGGDNVLEREGHAVSAGFALGLVALGHGEDTLGFINTFVNRLFLYIGGKVQNERSHFSTNSMDENRGSAQMMDGTTINIDVTAPGATVALALMFLKTESEAIVSRLPIPSTYFDLQYVRPDFIMLRVIARNLIMWSRVHPSKDWVLSQIPQVVKCGVEGLGGDGEGDDVDDMDAEAFVQAYVNVVAGACISLGLVFAGTRNGNAQELLYEFAIYFLNEIKPVSPTSSGKVFPKGLSRYIDRVTLETCLHLIVLSLSVVMAGSGHLQTFQLLRFLRSRNCADGQSSYGIQMAVSLATGFLFLGGGMRTFSTNNSAIAALLITLYPRMPTGPNDNRCHLQAFRHLYVLATEARWVQTVDVDTGLPVYAPLEVTIRETEHYAESSFCEVTPCLLPERAILKRIRVCGPRYWPQVIDFAPEDKPWWNFGDKNNPFNSGVLYIKRKVGACSYVDDPIGCQSLLSRAMHKVFGLTSSKASDTISDIHSGSSAATVDQLVSTFSSDPSLIAFAQLCCDPSWYSRSDADFKEFCLQVLFECVSKDRPALLQVYLSLYTTVESMVGQVTTGAVVFGDSLSISAFKLALTYIEALMTQKLSAPKGGIIQSTFVGSLRKQVEELLNGSQELRDDFHKYLKLGTWPNGESQDKRSILLSWFLHWYDVPTSSAIKFAIDRVKPKLMSSSSVPLLHLCFPRTHINVISEIHRCFSS
ncbi:anaphase-promoting complex subunit 1 isoform X1 [Arachis duranensis]|uniref:Anaphase-promoting complex subunit 1 n=1 Tax=Arachis duranensis TaxID=130453 RepID=A0A6P4B2X0_ARADU|nr:anaphase-promoting complex subunit 1 isoform X1 [Arachis duranensis]